MHFLLIGYMFLFIHRPFELWPALGEVHLERVYMLLTMAVWVLTPNKRWLPNPLHWAFLAFILATGFCWMLSPWMNQGQLVVENYFKIVVFYVLLVTAVHDERKLKHIVIGFLCIMAIYMLHSLKEYIGGRHTYRMGIPRMIGVDSTLGDPNSFGGSIVLTLTLVPIFWHRAKGWFKLALVSFLGLSLLCVVLTGSRSAMVGLIILSAFLAMRSRHRFALAGLGIVAAPLIFLAMPEYLQNRFESTINPEVGPANAYESGKGRLEGLLLGFDLLEQYPLTGCGPGAWIPATGRDLESHNLYGQCMGEMGVLGIITFGAVVVALWRNARKLARTGKNLPPGADDFLPKLGQALTVSIFMLLLMGNFGHNLFRFNWLWFGAFLIIARYCVTARVAVPVQQPRPVWARPALRLLPRV